MPTDTFNFVRSFSEKMAEKIMDFTPSTGDTFKVALCSVAPDSADVTLSDLTHDETNADSVTVTVASSGYSGDTYTCDFTDKTITASGGAIPTFRYVALYDDTVVGDPLIGWVDYGGNVDVASGETFAVNNLGFTITFTNP
jgi:hypothetical protein